GNISIGEDASIADMSGKVGLPAYGQHQHGSVGKRIGSVSGGKACGGLSDEAGLVPAFECQGNDLAGADGPAAGKNDDSFVVDMGPVAVVFADPANDMSALAGRAR